MSLPSTVKYVLGDFSTSIKKAVRECLPAGRRILCGFHYDRYVLFFSHFTPLTCYVPISCYVPGTLPKSRILPCGTSSSICESFQIEISTTWS